MTINNNVIGEKRAVMPVVDYDRCFKDLIEARNYDCVDPAIIEENFPAETDEKGTKEQLFTLYHFGRDMRSEDVIAAMDEDGKRPATIRELLAYDESNSLQSQFPILALKSVWVCLTGGCRVACLDGHSGERYLFLYWCVGLWEGRCRFLAVNK